MPLTEDWLVRFGLIFRREDEAGRHFYFKDYSEYDPWLILCNGGTVSIVEEHCCYDYNVLKSGIKYVHKLQNIIYELDDIELDVNNSLHEK